MTDPVIIEAQPNHNCNCVYAPLNNPPLYGGKGTTVWFSDTLTLPYLQPVSISFTDTRPDCFSGGTDICLVIYEIATTMQSGVPVRIERRLNGHPLGSSTHSVIGNHNVTEDFELVCSTFYNHGALNTFTFINNALIPVEIRNLRIIRSYGMWGLAPYNQQGDPNDLEHFPCRCNGDTTIGANGSLDNTRQDYPCNYAKIGERIGYVHFGANKDVPSIAAHSSQRWKFQNPPDTYANNYIGPYACLFNFNNVRTINYLGNDLHYQIKIKDSRPDGDGQFHVIADYYHSGDIVTPSQFPTADLTESKYYNDQPGAWNEVELFNDGSANLVIDNSEYGGVDVYRFYKVNNLCQDSFNNDDINNNLWDTLQNGGSIAINGGLQVTTPGGSWYQAGEVTRYAYNTQAFYPESIQQGFEATIDVTSRGNLKEMAFLISSDSQANSQDPSSLSNWYRIVKCAADSTVKVQNRLSGGTVSTKLSEPWASSSPTGTGQLKIKVSTGSIAFYENGILKYAEPFALPSANCYLYIYANSDQSGTGTFDNFKISPAQIFRTEFNNGDISGWDIDGINSNWSVQNGKLRSTTTGSHIHYIQEFAKNRHLRVDIKSLSNGGDRNVAWLMAKEVDGNNLVCGLIRTGYVELGIFYGGQQYWYPASSSLDPTQSHSMAISIIENNAKVWVDGTLYLNVTDNSLSATVFNEGYIGLYTPGCTGEFDYVAVLNAKGYYTINASAGAGGSISPAGTVQVAENANKSFTITPNSGYHVRVYIDGVNQGNLSTYTFNSIADNHTISAQFIPTYTIMSSANSGGSIDPGGSVIVEQGTDRGFTIATASSFYQISDVVVDNTTHLGAQTSPITYTFENVQGNHTISVTFSLAAADHTPIILGVDGVAITPPNVTFVIDENNYTSGDMAFLTINENHLFSVSPTTSDVYGDYTFEYWDILDGGANHVRYEYCNPVSFQVTSSTQFLTAIYTTNPATQYTVSASAGSYGAVTPNTATVAQGSCATFKITPNSGCEIADVLFNGTSVLGNVSNNQYTANNINGNSTLYATFNPPHISASADTGGSISPPGTVYISPGENQTFNISANSCYQISTVTVDGVSQGAISTYTFNNIQANHTIIATFNLIQYSITTSAGTGGSISPTGTINVNCGANQTYTINSKHWLQHQHSNR